MKKCIEDIESSPACSCSLEQLSQLCFEYPKGENLNQARDEAYYLYQRLILDSASI
jgi:hypothetical protein